MLRPDLAQIKRTLGILFRPGDTVELRCVGNRTINGFYRDLDQLAADAVRLNGDFSPRENVYVCLNPVDPQLFARRPNQFGICRRGEAVSDYDVVCRRWLLVDVDPERPTGVSATNEQKQAAFGVAQQAHTWLCDRFPGDSIVCADSGNGGHMLLQLDDIPNDEQSRWFCERLLQLLHERFTCQDAKIDASMFNAARICTLYGTIKRKGAALPEQPHRLSGVIHAPDHN